MAENVRVKNKIVKRILNHSVVYNEGELSRLSINALKELQEKSLISAVVKLKFKNRGLL